jgi:hypothetical protein
MPIEWVPILSAALKGGTTGGTAKAAGLLVEKVKGKVFPGELKLALDKAVDAAQRRDVSLAANQHLFYHCDDKQQRDFLGKVLEASLLLEELQKPIENNGSIDQAVLLLLFQQVATELKVNLVPKSLPGWIRAFADTYFEQTTAAIRFQAAKGKYLESLARRVDDVKFVGIDVPGEEVEKQGQLVKIFVMPDVRSDIRRFKPSELSEPFDFIQLLNSIKNRKSVNTGMPLNISLLSSGFQGKSTLTLTKYGRSVGESEKSNLIISDQDNQEFLALKQETVAQWLIANQVFNNQHW